MESLAELMGLRPGVTAVIGGGGKTTFLRTAGELLAQQHSVLLCTTTRILPFAGLPLAETAEELERLRERERLVCAGKRLPEQEKLTAPALSFERLAERFEYVLVEADGSAQRPLKAHAAHEPVIPENADQVIAIVGAAGFGRPICMAAHRPELYAKLAAASVDTAVTPELAAAVLNKENLHQRVFINQVDTIEQFDWARRFAACMTCPTAAGSLQRGEWFPCV